MPPRPHRTITHIALAFGLALLAYLALWPVPIDPVAWDAPTDRGFVGDFAVDFSLAGAERIPLGDHTCGLSSAGSVYCWGFGQGRQLGDGSATSVVLRPEKKVKNLP